LEEGGGLGTNIQYFHFLMIIIVTSDHCSKGRLTGRGNKKGGGGDTIGL